MHSSSPRIQCWLLRGSASNTETQNPNIFGDRISATEGQRVALGIGKKWAVSPSVRTFISASRNSEAGSQCFRSTVWLLFLAGIYICAVRRVLFNTLPDWPGTCSSSCCSPSTCWCKGTSVCPYGGGGLCHRLPHRFRWVLCVVSHHLRAEGVSACTTHWEQYACFWKMVIEWRPGKLTPCKIQMGPTLLLLY